MRIGIPKEIKDGELRAALTPAGAGALVRSGHEVIVEPGVGRGAGFADEKYIEAKAKPGNPWDADLVVKVKELQEPEHRLPRKGQTVFCFQHFNIEPELLDAALASGARFVAFEAVVLDDGSLPILAPMSAIAGRLAVQAGLWCLQKQNGGSGVLLAGMAGVAPGKVTILGAGHCGSNALALAAGLGARVCVFAKSQRRFAALRSRYPGVEFRNDLENLGEVLADTDLVIAGILTPELTSPTLITRAMLRHMKPGSVLVDVGVDHGGIAETSRITSHSAPIYIEEGVVHYCVPNMPAAFPATASLALEKAILPFALELASGRLSGTLRRAIQAQDGKVTHEALARDAGRPYQPL
jgi:alanine dehydrogenase